MWPNELHEFVSKDTRLAGEQGTEWSFLFGKTLAQIILDEKSSMSTKETTRLFGDYEKWQDEKVDPYLDTLAEVRDNSEINQSARVAAGTQMQHFGFHLLNRRFSTIWHSELTEAKPQVKQEAIKTSARDLAFAGTWLAYVREKQIKDVGLSAFINATGQSDHSFLEGLLAEYDTAMVLLELAKKKHQNLLVVPAPAQFEYLSGKHNSDLIVQDKDTDSSLGVQVKNKVTFKDVEHYDKDRVMLVDAGGDLGNTKAELMIDGRNTKIKTFKWGGQLCMEYFCRQKLTTQQLRSCQGMKFFAQARTKGTNKYLETAKKVLEDRLSTKI